MSTELTNPQNTDLALGDSLPPVTDLSILNSLGGTVSYLPYIQLIQAGSRLCQPPTSFPQGVFALKQSRNEISNIGNELEVYVCEWRPKAMFTDKARNITKSIHNHELSEFKEMRAQAEDKIKGYFWGFEFLLYDGKSGKYMTLFCNNPTLRRAAKEKGFSFLHKKSTLSSIPLSDTEHSWWGILFAPFNGEFEVPYDLDEMTIQINSFKATTEEELPDTDDEAIPFETTTERAR